MKKNNDSLSFSDWTTKKLKDEARSYDQTINQIGCYGTSDVRTLMAIEKELDSRGVEIYRQINFN